MFETLKVIGITIYSQAVVFLFDLVAGKNIEVYQPDSNTLNWFSFFFYFFFFQTALYVFLPGEIYEGPVTVGGQRPKYRENGFKSWVVTGGCEAIGLNYLGSEQTAVIFDQIGDMQKCLNILGIIFVSLLTLNAYLSPISKLNEPKFRENFLVSCYKGVELHPTFFDLSWKILINSRFGMMLWGCIVIASMFARPYRNVLASGILQLIYISKFFYWEKGYTKSADITVDRCGYYLFWGCICYLPCIYTIPTVYHYFNPTDMITDLEMAVTLFSGALAIYLNWSVDNQKVELRKNKQKCMMVWGSPAKFIEAEYTTSNGIKHKSCLVACGWAGVARYINYFFEISASLIWTMAGTVPANPFAYSYVIYLTILLIHRTYRLDKKCLTKYGAAWETYVKEVPWKIIPYIY